MPCGYLNESKDNVMDGVYCNKLGGRPGVNFWRYYCDSCPSDCPYNGGRDPQELLPETRERNRVIQRIADLPSRITVRDGDRISTARWEYDHLSYEQQRFVSNYSRLTQAERDYANAVAEAEAGEREPIRRQQEDRRRQQQTVREQQRTTTVRNEQVPPVRLTPEQRRRGWVVDLTTGQPHRLTARERFWFWLRNITDPHMRNTSWWIRGYRIALPVLAWLLMLAYSSRQIPVELMVLTAFATLQLISFIVAFVRNDAMRLRMVLWGVELILLCIVGVMIWLNPAHLAEAAVVLFIYPALVIAYWLLTRMFGTAM